MRVTIIFGTILIVAAVAWRVVSGYTARLRLARALEAPDAETRRSAIDIATSHGLDRHVRALLRRVEHETDETVLGALAEAVARNAWEPADNPRVLQLRLWAEARRRARRPDDSPAARPPLPSGEISGRRIMVTGAGGPAGVNVIRALLAAGHDVIALDADPLAAGLHLASEAELIVTADHPSFVDQLLDVARIHQADALVPTIAEEMLVLADRRDDVVQRVAAWLPAREAIEACVDKWRFACVMASAGIVVPATSLATGADVPGPWVVKPRCARGSRGVIFVERHEDLDYAVRSTPDPIVQTRAVGREFTVDALVSPNGELVGAVPRWRLETRGGISTKGRTFHDDEVTEGVTSVLTALGLVGAANVQGFVDDGAVTFIEVNPRFSGGLSLSLAAGADLVGEYLRGVVGLPPRADRLGFRPDTTMIRHFEEIYT